MSKLYAVYKGDTFITVGTIKEIAKELNVKETTVRYWSAPAYKKRYKMAKMVYVIGKED